jgi:hypothetical protein
MTHSSCLFTDAAFYSGSLSLLPVLKHDSESQRQRSGTCWCLILRINSGMAYRRHGFHTPWYDLVRFCLCLGFPPSSHSTGSNCRTTIIRVPWSLILFLFCFAIVMLSQGLILFPRLPGESSGVFCGEGTTRTDCEQSIYWRGFSKTDSIRYDCILAHTAESDSLTRRLLY